MWEGWCRRHLSKLVCMQVGAAMAWSEIGKDVGLPDTLIDKQSVCRRRYKAARLDEFSEVPSQTSSHCVYTPRKLNIRTLPDCSQ